MVARCKKYTVYKNFLLELRIVLSWFSSDIIKLYNIFYQTQAFALLRRAQYICIYIYNEKVHILFFRIKY